MMTAEAIVLALLLALALSLMPRSPLCPRCRGELIAHRQGALCRTCGYRRAR
jgi:tRNA(Ile2) C34 agmatinyltransferase TiaS